MSMFKEFKTFALKGNLVDVAIAFVMGLAFNNVITSFTGGIVSPLIGLLTGQDLSKVKWIVRQSTEVKNAAGEVISGTPEIALQTGAFLMALIDFFVIAFICYLIIRNVLKKDPNAAPDPTPTEELLTEIRDELRNK